MSAVYLDTGVLLKLYTRESNTPEAATLVQGYPPPLPLTFWQELELRTALRCRLFRKEITRNELASSIRAFEEDLKAGRWERAVYDVSSVHHQALRLSAQHAAVLGCRTLDILHVAAALILATHVFVTFDIRQAALARKTRLKVSP